MRGGRCRAPDAMVDRFTVLSLMMCLKNDHDIFRNIKISHCNSCDDIEIMKCCDAWHSAEG
jgi:hypothetical protein